MRSRLPHILAILAINAVLLFVWLRTASAVGAPVQDNSYSAYLPVIAAAQPVYISELNSFNTPGGGILFRGEVMNVADMPIYGVVIRTIVTDEDGQTFELTTTPVFTATLFGQPNPFEQYVGVDPYSVEIISIEISDWTTEHEPAIAGATVISILEHYEWSYAFITTTVRNDAPVPLYNVVGFAWYYQTWSRYESQPVVDVLHPGETAEFYTFLDGLGPSAVPIEAGAQGELGP